MQLIVCHNKYEFQAEQTFLQVNKYKKNAINYIELSVQSFNCFLLEIFLPQFEY